MHRAVTAIYRSHAAATLVRDELERLGIARDAITVIPDSDRGPDPATPGTTFGTAGGAFVAAAPFSGAAFPVGTYVDTGYAGGVHGESFDRLHDLHLPEDDTRTYQQAIRNGDYVVSVEVQEDADIARIQEVMRRPEDAHDLDELSSRYGEATYEARRQPLGSDYDERWVGRHDETRSSPYTRSYTRGAPLGPARRQL